MLGRVAAAEHGRHGRAHGRGDVHGPGVAAEVQIRAADQAGIVLERRHLGGHHGVAPGLVNHLPDGRELAGPPGQHHLEAAVGQQQVGQFGEVLEGPLLLGPVHGRVHGHDPFAPVKGILEKRVDFVLDLRGNVDGHVDGAAARAKGPAARAKGLAQQQVFFDAVEVGRGELDLVVREKVAELLRPRASETIAVWHSGTRADETALEDPMEVDEDVVAASADVSAESPKGPRRGSDRLRALEHQQPVEGRVVLENGRGLVFHGPVDLRVGKGLPQRVKRGENPHDVPDGAQADDQDAGKPVNHGRYFIVFPTGGPADLVTAHETAPDPDKRTAGQCRHAVVGEGMYQASSAVPLYSPDAYPSRIVVFPTQRVGPLDSGHWPHLDPNWQQREDSNQRPLGYERWRRAFPKLIDSK